MLIDTITQVSRFKPPVSGAKSKILGETKEKPGPNCSLLRAV